MRKQLMIKEKEIHIVYLIGAVVILALIGISIYFAVSGGADLAATEQEPLVKFTEQFVPTTDEGDAFQYIIQAKNTGAAAYYIRVKIKTGMKNKEEAVWLEKNINDTWDLEGDYCYYTKALTAGETSEPVLKNVKTDDSFLLLKKKTTIVLEKSDYVEAEGYDSAEAAFNAQDQAAGHES